MSIAHTGMTTIVATLRNVTVVAIGRSCPTIACAVLDRIKMKLGVSTQHVIKKRLTLDCGMQPQAPRSFLLHRQTGSHSCSEYRFLSVSRFFKRASRAAATRSGIPCSPHVFRHTAGVWMAQNDVPMQKIAQFLGHTSTRVTERTYARYSPSFMKDAAAALEL